MTEFRLISKFGTSRAIWGIKIYPKIKKGIIGTIKTKKMLSNNGILVFLCSFFTIGKKETVKTNAMMIIGRIERTFQQRNTPIPTTTIRVSASQLNGCSCFSIS